MFVIVIIPLCAHPASAVHLLQGIHRRGGMGAEGRHEDTITITITDGEEVGKAEMRPPRSGAAIFDLVPWWGSLHTDAALKIMQTVCRALVFCLSLFATLPAWGVHFVYIIDTSDSMKSRGAATKAKAAVMRDVGRLLNAGGDVLRPGDHIHLWTFSDDVTERFAVRYDINWDKTILEDLKARLDRLEPQGRTSLARPILQFLQSFNIEEGPVNVFVYTDGRDVLTSVELEAILRVYRERFQSQHQLANAVLVQVGHGDLPEQTRVLMSSLGGRAVDDGARFDLNPVVRPAPVVEPPPAAVVEVPKPPVLPPADDPEPIPPPPPVIKISPTAIEISVEPGTETVRAVPIEFAVEPPQSGLVVQVNLKPIGSWPGAMSIQTLSDRLATEGKQSLSFLVKDAKPGMHQATLKFGVSGIAQIEPPELPVRIEVLAPNPEAIQVQFFPDQLSPIQLKSLDQQWQDVRDLGVMFVYADSAKETKVRFDWDASAELGLRILPVSPASEPIAPGESVALTRVGRLARFQIRKNSAVSRVDAVSGNITLALAGGQPAVLSGTNTVVIPFQPAQPFEMEVRTNQIVLGNLRKGTEQFRTSLDLETRGDFEEMKLRVRTEGKQLAAVQLSPAEAELKRGESTIDLRFSGLERIEPGPIDGSIVITAVERSGGEIAGEIKLPVRGRILEPGVVALDVQNPMVAGQPIRIFARSEATADGHFKAIIELPDGDAPQEVVLADNGSSEAGDERAGDGVYSGLFAGANALGMYRVRAVGIGAMEGVESAVAEVPIYFRPPDRPLSGRLVNRQRGEFMEFKFPLISEFPSEIAIATEPASSDIPLNSFVSSKYLKRGENELDLVVTVNDGARSGDYEYEINLLAEPVQGQKVRIPVRVKVHLISFFQYFVRLMAVALGIAFAVFLVFFGPWRSYWSRQENQRSKMRSVGREQEIA